MSETKAPYQVKKDWGRVLLVTRLEKMVDSQFVECWSHLITKGLRGPDHPVETLKEVKRILTSIDEFGEDAIEAALGVIDLAFKYRGFDGFLIVKDRVAHQAVNDAIRVFLRSDFDSICFIDSDFDAGPGYIEELRTLEDGFEFDIFQGFYVRRGWPPEAIWFKETELGDVVQSLVWKDNHTEETSMVGFHNCLIRREVFEGIRASRPEVDIDDFTWAYYPKDNWQSEDGVFCQDARDLGYRVGSTTKVKCGHISRHVTGWETYQEYLSLSGALDHWQGYYDLIELVADFYGESYEMVMAKVARGYEYTRDHWIESDPKTSEEIRSFYGDKDNGYLYDLLAWNVSPTYKSIVEPLRAVNEKNILVIGGGLGGEVERLKGRNAVTVFEIEGVLSEFLFHRYENELEIDIYFDKSLGAWVDDCDPGYNHKFDLIVAVDVIEHIPPEELDATLTSALGLLQDTGSFYIHNNFGAQEMAPQHFDNSAAFAKWIEDNEIEQISDLEYKRKDHEKDAN